MVFQSRVTILVKAYPLPSKKHSETVCCAGIDASGNWRRLFPIRFRQLDDSQAFKRWNIVDFEFSKPPSDSRRESCRVHEESIEVVGAVTRLSEKQNIVEPAIVPSEKHAIANGQSLALIRPRNVNFFWKERSFQEVAEAREAFEAQAKQASMFDKVLDILEPCRFMFTMTYDDEAGPHTKTCADWETSAAFFNLDRKYGTAEALEHLRSTYCDQYVNTGLVLALGNKKIQPQTWQLLGIFPVASSKQTSMLF